jgi:hypothetical protein
MQRNNKGIESSAAELGNLANGSLAGLEDFVAVSCSESFSFSRLGGEDIDGTFCDFSSFSSLTIMSTIVNSDDAGASLFVSISPVAVAAFSSSLKEG